MTNKWGNEERKQSMEIHPTLLTKIFRGKLKKCRKSLNAAGVNEYKVHMIRCHSTERVWQIVNATTLSSTILYP